MRLVSLHGRHASAIDGISRASNTAPCRPSSPGWHWAYCSCCCLPRAGTCFTYYAKAMLSAGEVPKAR